MTTRKKTPYGCLFLVDRGGFEPPKSETSDLQSDPFGRSGICPFRSVQQCKLWSRWLDSNPQPADYKSAALPIELHRRMVPQGGIEPPTEGFSVPCSTNWAIEACLPSKISFRQADNLWRPKRGSNSWPPAWQAGALTKLSYWAVQQDMKNFGGPSRIRTADQSVMSRQLWPLS